MGDTQHRLFVRCTHPSDPIVGEGRLKPGRDAGATWDAAVVPGLLLLVARDLLLHDPTRVLAWRFLHDPRLAELPRWLTPLVPRPSASLDRDPIALLLGAIAVGAAVAYLVLASSRVAAVWRLRLVVLAAGLLVAAPTAGFVALSIATERPYGQDGGVVQLPLAIEKVLAAESPYGADYSDSILGKEARRSDFWNAYGANPILHHHAYLPGTHLLMLPAYLALRGAGLFDPRLVTLLAWLLAAVLAAALVAGEARRACALALVLVNPLVYWHQIFGANDLLVVALLLLALWLGRAERPLAAGAVLGLACATKQLAWPFAPFLLGWLSGAHTLRDLTGRIALRRLAGPAAAALGVFLLVVVPVAALDPRRFWADIVVYNAGLPGGDNYPLGGTPGFGFANFVIYAGRVASLRDYAPLGWFYLLLIPLGLLLLRYQLREGGPSSVLVTGSGALLASLYASRVVHPNYLILPAILLPLGFLMGERRPADVAAVPLLLLATAVEIADQALLRSVWEDAVAVRLPQHLSGLAADLGPRAGPGLTQDPLGLVWSALAAGVAVVYLLVGILGAGARLRIGLIVTAVVAVCVVPTVCVMQIGAVTAEPRAQDGWFASASARPAREAWSESFRRDPPAVLVDTHPAPASLGPLVARLGLGDPRGLSLIAVALAALLLAWLVPSGSRPLALAILVSPPLVVGTVFGSGDVLLLAIVLASLWLTRRGREAGGGLAWGIGIAGFPRALCLAPLALPGGRTARRITAAVLGCAVIWIACVAVGGVSTPANPSALAPGVGLSNLFLYWGAEGSTAGRVATLALQLAAGGAVLWLGMRRDPISLAGAAALLTTGLFLASGTSSHDLLVPLALCMLSATLPAPTDETEAFGG